MSLKLLALLLFFYFPPIFAKVYEVGTTLKPKTCPQTIAKLIAGRETLEKVDADLSVMLADDRLVVDTFAERSNLNESLHIWVSTAEAVRQYSASFWKGYKGYAVEVSLTSDRQKKSDVATSSDGPRRGALGRTPLEVLKLYLTDEGAMLEHLGMEAGPEHELPIHFTQKIEDRLQHLIALRAHRGEWDPRVRIKVSLHVDRNSWNQFIGEMEGKFGAKNIKIGDHNEPVGFGFLPSATVSFTCDDFDTIERIAKEPGVGLLFTSSRLGW